MTVLALELPSVQVDAVAEYAAGAALLCADRDPAPGEADVPLAAPVRFSLIATGAGAAVTLASVVVTVRGVTAYTGGAFAVSFSGSVTTTANRLDFVVQPAVPFASLSAVPVTVAASATDATTVAASWSFTALDATSPVLVAAVARSLRVVRATFTEPMLAALLTDPTQWALSPGVRPVWLPVYIPAPIAVAMVGANAADVTFASELSPAAPYVLTVGPVTDLDGNVAVAPTNAVAFTAAAPPVPAGRAFDLYSMLPAVNRREDLSGTLDLRKFVACYQDVNTLLLGELDAALDILDPDYAPSAFLDSLLYDFGNPFTFDLDDTGKRLLLAILLPLYRQKGTDRGIAAAVLFFLGITITITDYATTTLTLGESQLGVDWILGPGMSWDLYAFDVTIVVTPTDVQRRQLIAIVEFMKPAWTHFVNLIEPAGVVTPVDPWTLGLGDGLGVDTLLH